MSSIRCIMTVARTESLIISRSWVFRFFAVASCAMLVFLYIGTYGFSPGGWRYRSVPSSVVYYSVLAMTLMQSLIVPFCAVESLRRETTCNTTESLYTRNFANVWYIAGKALGVMIPFLVLTIAILPAVLAANAVFMTDTPVVWQAFFYYPLILVVPTLLWLTGLSFFVASMIRITALALVMVTVYSVYAFTQLGGPIERIIDFTGFHLPLLYSDFVGFGNMHEIILHRMVYVLGGIGLVTIVGVRFTRLPQSLKIRLWAIRTASISTVLAMIVGYFFLAGTHDGIVLRKHMNNLAQEYVNKPRARITGYALDIDHDGNKLNISANLTLTNPSEQSLETLVFTLNPGFDVSSVSLDGTKLSYNRDTQILIVKPPSPLASGDTKKLNITYAGASDNDACYIDIDEDERAFINRIYLAGADKQYGFVTPGYVLLTPECTWYPVSGIPYGWVFPDAHWRDFAEYEVTVKTSVGMTVISQANVSNNGNGSFGFTTDERLPGLTLIIGEYEKKSLTIDGIEYSMYVRPGHDYFSHYLKNAKEITARVIQDIRQQYEIQKGMKYPFNRYMVVETPVQFMAYERPWCTYTEIIQPQMALLPERGVFLQYSNISERFAYQTGGINSERSSQISENLIHSFVLYAMVSDELTIQTLNSNRVYIEQIRRSMFGKLWMNFVDTYNVSYDIDPQFYSFLISIESDRYPVMNAVMEQYNKRGLSYIADGMNRSSVLSSAEIACMALERNSLEELIGQNNTEQNISRYLSTKTNQLFSSLGAYTGIDESEEMINRFIEHHRGSFVDLDTFVVVLLDSLGWDMRSNLDTWYKTCELPVYTIGNKTLYQYENGLRTYYQTLYTVTNISDVQGTVLCGIEITNNDGSRETISRYINLEAHQSKEIGFISDNPPNKTHVNTIVSKNIPIIKDLRLGNPIIAEKGFESFDGERKVPYQPLLIDHNAIIVDDLDPGFAILSEPAEMTSREVIRAEMYPEGFMPCQPGLPAHQWVKASFMLAYGFPKQTARYTGPGNGEGRVGWTAGITEAGTYDLSHHFFARGSAMVYGVGSDHSLSDWPLVGEYIFTVTAADTSYTVKMVPPETGGWLHLGTFDLKPGEVTVELTNKSTGRLIYADAIKWTRKH